MLAGLHGFTYASIRISKSKTRWGSCSSKKNIGLSLFLMQLPLHLIDYVLLHELCHTVEMNHSRQFWELLDGVCNRKAKALRKELKSFRI
jgi:predicted metal-dependent hydrolase